MERDYLLRKHFTPINPKTLAGIEFRATLELALKHGCDWLEQMQELNPLPAEVVENMAQKIEDLEYKLAEVEKQKTALVRMIEENYTYSQEKLNKLREQVQECSYQLGEAREQGVGVEEG